MKEIAFKAIRKPLNRKVLSTTKGLQLANQISFERSFRWKQVYLVPSSNIIKFSHECQNYTKKLVYDSPSKSRSQMHSMHASQIHH